MSWKSVSLLSSSFFNLRHSSCVLSLIVFFISNPWIMRLRKFSYGILLVWSHRDCSHEVIYILEKLRCSRSSPTSSLLLRASAYKILLICHAWFGRIWARTFHQWSVQHLGNNSVRVEPVMKVLLRWRKYWWKVFLECCHLLLPKLPQSTHIILL